MKPSRLLLIAGIAVLVFAVLSACGSPGPGPIASTPVGPQPPVGVRGTAVGVTPAASQAPFIIPTATATPLPTPIPTKPRPGYTPVPDTVLSPQVIDQNPYPGQEAAPESGIQLDLRSRHGSIGGGERLPGLSVDERLVRLEGRSDGGLHARRETRARGCV